ncbi:tyrosine-type recombinase/integrase [Rhodococcus ruber]|uniref:tyrosine-type recombinase/integrase n=1 Tax=Rhodococcus ruber TaxID=1830 RepID=UPI003D8147A9
MSKKPCAWTDPIALWLAWLAAGGRPKTTLALRGYHLRRVARDVGGDPWSVTVEDLAAFLGKPGWSPEYRRSIRSSLVSFYAWAHASGRTRTNPAALLPTVPVPAGVPRPAPEAALRYALERADERTLLMISLAAYGGLRRAEIAVVHSRDVIESFDGWVLRVHGKGGKTRQLPLVPEVARRLRALPEGYAFPGRIDGHLSPAHVGKLISRALPDPWTAHTLRHRFATAAYRADRDLIAVQQLLGHSSVATTQRYTALPDDALRRAVLGAVA